MPQDLLELLGNTQDGVFVVDGKQRIIVWNAGAREILGYEANEVLGRPCHDVLAGDLAGTDHQCMQDCNVMLVTRQGGLPPSHTAAARTKDGRDKLLSITHIAIPMETSRNETALVHVFRDVTQDVAARHVVEDLVQFVRSSNLARPSASPTKARPSVADSLEATPLTPREIQALQLMAEGCGTDEIADRLVISVSTARNHIQNMLEKLGVHSRMEAVIYGINHRLIAIGQGR